MAMPTQNLPNRVMGSLPGKLVKNPVSFSVLSSYLFAEARGPSYFIATLSYTWKDFEKIEWGDYPIKFLKRESHVILNQSAKSSESLLIPNSLTIPNMYELYSGYCPRCIISHLPPASVRSASSLRFSFPHSCLSTLFCGPLCISRAVCVTGLALSTGASCMHLWVNN